MSDLLYKKCLPCEGGVKPFTRSDAESMLGQVAGWQLVSEGSVESPLLMITREFSFKDFKEALLFVNRVGMLAEDEGHHPNIYLYSWNKVRIELYTHAIGGLSENDFIVAAKINAMVA